MAYAKKNDFVCVLKKALDAVLGRLESRVLNTGPTWLKDKSLGHGLIAFRYVQIEKQKHYLSTFHGQLDQQSHQEAISVQMQLSSGPSLYETVPVPGL